MTGPSLTRPPWVDCANPRDCEWRPYTDTAEWIHCGTDGCGVETRVHPEPTA